MNKNEVFLTSNKNSSNFNYQQLNPEVRDEIQELTVDIKNRLRHCAQDIYVIGNNLCQIKQQLKHGQFRTWLKAEFDWSVSAANKFMHVSQRFKLDELEKVEISPSALYILAAPSTPKEVRNQALEKAKQGQTISFSFAKQLIKSNQEQPLEQEINNEPENDVITQESHPENPNQLSLAHSNLFELMKTEETQANLSVQSVQIYNYSHFNNYLEQEWQRMFRAEQYLSLLLCQIDLQDSHQKETRMSQVLQQLSYGLAFSLKRVGDFVGQYNNHQCIAVLPNTHPEGVQCVIDRFMKWFTPWQKNLNQSDEFNNLKIYIGTASIIPKQGFTPHSLIKTALLNQQLME
ncbi:MAG: diguanylate cyclase [Crocosphaera sp.]|nr:diguanylate cyclase [Crocosphaera sp.]